MHAEIDGELLDLWLRLGGAVHPNRTLTQLKRVLSGAAMVDVPLMIPI
ncbi:hypothetical protein AB0M86_48165 [Streptomyces sp. NPDC051639]